MKISLVIALFISVNSFAQDKGGNGGDAIVCKENGVETYHFYDVYEAGRNKLQVDINPEWTFDQALDEYLSRLKRVDSWRFEKYTFANPKNEPKLEHHGIYGNFLTELRLMNQMVDEGKSVQEMNDALKIIQVESTKIKDIPDEGLARLPEYCEHQQLVIQLPQPDFLNHYRYFNIILPVWKNIPPAERAAVALHELFYREAVERGYSDSRFARLLNEMVLANLSRFDYASKMLDANQKAVEQRFPRMPYSVHVPIWKYDYEVTKVQRLGSTSVISADLYSPYRGWGSQFSILFNEDMSYEVGMTAVREKLGYKSVGADDRGMIRFAGTFIGGPFAIGGFASGGPVLGSAMVVVGVGLWIKSYRPRTWVLNNKMVVRSKRLVDVDIKPGDAYPDFDPKKRHSSLYFFDAKGALRYVVDPQLAKIKVAGKKYNRVDPVLEFDRAGNMIQSGSVADFDAIVKKLEQEGVQ